MLFRPASFLLLSVSFLGALATTKLGKGVEVAQVPVGITDPDFGKGYWFQEVHADKATTILDKDLQDAAQQGWEKAKAMAPGVKLKPSAPNGAQVPAIMAALFIPGHGTIVASSIRPGVGAVQSVQTCKIITWQHRNFGNCAEPNTLAIAMQQGWITAMANSAIPAGSKMAVYGRPSKKMKPGFQAPCEEHAEKGPGCQKLLADNNHIKMVNPVSKRAVEFVV